MAFLRYYSGRSAMQGDPFLGIRLPKIRLPKLTLGKVLGAAGTVTSFVPGPVGIIGRVGKMSKIIGAAKTGAKMLGAGAALGAGSELAGQALRGAQGGFMPGVPTAGWATGMGMSEAEQKRMAKGLSPRKRYRRMNVTNMKALTRASRRVHRFAKIARTCIRQSRTVRCPKRGARGRKCA